MILKSFINAFKAKGVITIKATVHRQNAIFIGGILPERSRATIKLPDQNAVARRANK